jgi:hypothetical protein
LLVEDGGQDGGILENLPLAYLFSSSFTLLVCIGDAEVTVIDSELTLRADYFREAHLSFQNPCRPGITSSKPRLAT